MFRIRYLFRLITPALTAASLACSDEITPVAPDLERAAPSGVSQEVGGPTPPVINGRIVFTVLATPGNRDIYSMNPDGTDRRQLTSGPADDWSPDVSPDGRKIAFTRREVPGTTEQVYVMAADGSRNRKLTSFEPGTAREPAWSPDGKEIVFSGFPVGTEHADLFVMSAAGKNIRRLTDFRDVPAVSVDQPAWSPDGKRIAFSHRGICSNVMMMNADGTGMTNVTTCGTGGGHAPSWSPDGSRIAYERVTTLESILEVKAVVGQSVQQIATNLRAGFGGPAWSPDGTKLVYPGIATVDGFPRATLIAIGRDGSGMQPLVPAGTAGTFPAWGRSR
ncbi:MAG: exported protein of unknown function [Geminicoccaceae bacterium]|jgi:TolB protein|nr:exported protein of unknown function [Geminicoccaceae bacterium]